MVTSLVPGSVIFPARNKPETFCFRVSRMERFHRENQSPPKELRNMFPERYVLIHWFSFLCFYSLYDLL